MLLGSGGEQFFCLWTASLASRSILLYVQRQQQQQQVESILLSVGAWWGRRGGKRANSEGLTQFPSTNWIICYDTESFVVSVAVSLHSTPPCKNCTLPNWTPPFDLYVLKMCCFFILSGFATSVSAQTWKIFWQSVFEFNTL